MDTQIIGSHIIEIEETASTNIYTDKLLRSKKQIEGTVIIAYNQTAGQGQDQNKWESEPFQNLTFSIILYPTFLSPSDQFQLSKAMSLGIIDFLKSILQEHHEIIKIKWPNDIYVGNKKICGILIQNSITGNCLSDSIVGIGLNVNQSTFKSDAPNPISIKNLTGKEINLKDCLPAIYNALNYRYNQLANHQDGIIKQNYIDALYRFGEWHKYKIDKSILTAKINGISAYGQLLLEGKNGSNYVCNIKEVAYVL
ncbi:MAG: biotin--[acetyl-CoA-carboxylase] ligase [Bacteroidetes bacterium]|nr:biotin--[acetyl-CoA-carboxylase] ligase [Bacteroidota bacterium]